MRKQVFGRKFKRDVNERKALFKNLMSELVLHGHIKTTEEKAKAIRSSAEKLIGKAKKETQLARKLLGKELQPEAIERILSFVGKFDKRPGGYTRAIKIGRRVKDNAAMVHMEWVEDVTIKNASADKKEKKTKVVTVQPKEKKVKAVKKDTEIVEAEIVTEPAKKKVLPSKSGQIVKKTVKKTK